MDDLQNDKSISIPFKLMPPRAAMINFKHFTMPMIHPTTGETIKSYKKLMNKPATEPTWMLAFGNDFSGMCQGDNKTGQIRTDTMFIMTPTNIPNISTNQAVAYTNVVVNRCPPKDDPDQIQITAGGNLITGELSTRTADIMPSKLH